jgi:hypothetical protein
MLIWRNVAIIGDLATFPEQFYLIWLAGNLGNILGKQPFKGLLVNI